MKAVVSLGDAERRKVVRADIGYCATGPTGTFKPGAVLASNSTLSKIIPSGVLETHLVAHAFNLDGLLRRDAGKGARLPGGYDHQHGGRSGGNCNG